MKEQDIYKDIEQLIQKDGVIGSDIEIKSVEINKDGFSNDIAMFILTYSQNGKGFSESVVLKRFPNDERNIFGNANYTKEIGLFSNNGIIKSIHVPRIYAEDEQKRIMLMEKIEGITLDNYCLTNPEKAIKAFEKFGETLALIHSVELETVQHYFTKDDIYTADYFKLYIDRLKARVVQFQELEYLPILDRIFERFKFVECKEVLNHGDYHFLNVIVTDDVKLYILDWEKARIADYRYDIANTLVLGYTWFGIDFKKPMLEGYQRSSTRQIEQLDCFEALLSFDSFTKTLPLIQGGDDSHIRDRSFNWLMRRYELFVRHSGKRIKKAEDYLISKGLTLEF